MPDAEFPLPEGAVLVHVGPYKTGTSAIQMGLHQRRPDLAAHGVLYPGTDYRHRRESAAFLGRSPFGMPDVPEQEWRDLADAVAAAPGQRVVVSSEAFSSAAPEEVVRLADDLGRERVHALYVVRRLDRLMPSVWQERVKSSNEVRAYDAWLDPVLEGDDADAPARRFWSVHGVRDFLDRWGAVLPPERIWLVVADEGDHGQLPRLFERLLALPEGMLTADDRPNTGLSWEKVEAFRRLNQTFRDRDDWPADLRRALLMRGLLAALQQVPADDATVRLPALDAGRQAAVSRLSDERVSLVEDARAAGVTVVGEPERLRVPAEADGDTLPEPPTTVSLETMVAGLEGVIGVAAERERRLRRKAGKAGKTGKTGNAGKAGARAGTPGGGGADD